MTAVVLRIGAKMTTLILMLVYFQVAVHGAAHLGPTPAARLDKRQGFGAATVWSPIIVGTTVSCTFGRWN